MNADSVFILRSKLLFVIDSKKKKAEAIDKVLNAEWAADMVTGNMVTIKLEKLDTLYGRSFSRQVINKDSKSSKPIPLRTIYYNAKTLTKKNYEKEVFINDAFYEIYFQVGNHTIISPAICNKKGCKILDNILNNLFKHID